MTFAPPAAPLVDVDLATRLLDEAGCGAGPVRVSPLGAGHSNLTFLLERGRDRFVLRRPPLPPLPPSAHDVLREARILRALEGCDVRIPRVLAEAPASPFYIMEHVDGIVLSDKLPPALDAPVQRAALGRELVAALVALHAIEPPASFGHPDGYLARQVRRFTALWASSKTRDVAAIDEVAQGLERSTPQSGPPAVVHGDYRLGNLVVDRNAPAVRGILDWEMATVGDPLADVGYLTATWVEAGYTPGPLALTPLTREEGFPDRDELVATYEDLSRRRVERVHWYRALALWKATVFLEGNYRRWLDGQSTDDYYARIGAEIPELAELAREELDRDRRQRGT